MGQTPERYRRLRAIFDEALLHEPSAREAYVDHACAADPELKPEVMRLLAAHEDSQSFLERPPDLLALALRTAEPFSGTARFRVRAAAGRRRHGGGL